MEQGQLNWIANFIWGIADDVLRDLYVRGKYRDVILPMTVLRRLDAVLEPTKDGFSPNVSGHPRQLRVPQSDSAALEGGR
jgi:type I restriction-modification system DNA methylase subunit